MRPRSRTLTDGDAALVRALLARNWAQHDIASLLGCNQGRIAEIAAGERHAGVEPADLSTDAARAHIAVLENAWALRMHRMLADVLRPQGTIL
ncbi:hypothetical protein IMF23_00040 [Chelatococcus daeguensis]|uniref:Helix-turn-helix domain n=1 Tax=Chelatococcus sambhunathii TaxID=363953 RepID=A0ABP2A8N6_9HYPH|nr:MULTISPECIES: hypothetical protein [Chelatococcus]KZE34146.1 hypothetical protein AVW15_17685 [Chelatococcus daeguensis]MBM3081818.1 hypothetical protein [Chelatococcus daeguensis]CUA90841.1 hypothetical protein Ga0061061_1166 [Chelatococcus sambhunathii]